MLRCSVGARTRRVEFVSARLQLCEEGLLRRSKFRTSGASEQLSMYVDSGRFEFQVLGWIHVLSLEFTPAQCSK